MIETATAINTLRTSTEDDFVPSPDQLITLTYGQLSELIIQAVEKAIQPLQDRISSLEATEEQDISRLACDIAYDRQRISKLEKVEPQPLQKDRGEILRALIAANGGKMLAKDARQKMHLGKEQFSLLISKMSEYIETKPFRQDKRQLVLIIK